MGEKRNKIKEGRLIYLNLFLYLFVTPGSLDSHDYSIQCFQNLIKHRIQFCILLTCSNNTHIVKCRSRVQSLLGVYNISSQTPCTNAWPLGRCGTISKSRGQTHSWNITCLLPTLPTKPLNDYYSTLGRTKLISRLSFNL